MGRATVIPGQGAARLQAFALICALSAQPVAAQDTITDGPVPEAVAAVPPVAAPMPVSAAPPALAAMPPGTPQCPPTATDPAPCIPALTPVRLVIRAHLGSKISKSGEIFPIELAAPIVVDGKELVPAGTSGVGEVVHAKNSGGSGAGGELILAARYLDSGGRRLRLRSLNFASAGQDAYGTVQSINIASAVALPALSLIGFFIKGKGIDIPDGTEAMAKTAEPFALDPLPPALQAAPVSSPPPEQGAIP